jgi:hypothetical protein
VEHPLTLFDTIRIMATQPVRPEPEFRLEQLFRSDTLVMIRDFFVMMPELQRLVEHRVLCIYAIVDANRVHAELKWRLGKRESHQNRSGLEEALDSGVFVLIAPSFLKVEIEKYLPTIADQAGATLSQAQREWELFQTKLRFYQPSSHVPDGLVVDPKDMPYKHASDELGLPIYTSDRDLLEMGAPVLWVCVDTVCRDKVRTDTAACGHVRIDTACRDYARATSVTLGSTLGSAYTVTIGVEVLRAAVQGVKSLFEGFLRLPTWLQFAIAGALAAIVIHPRSRAKLLPVWNSACATARDTKGPLLDAFTRVIGEIAVAQSDADRTRRQVEAALPPTKKASAIVHARRICVVCAEPIPIKEIARRMRNEGYISRAKDFESYLRRVLRKDDQFVEISHGTWKLRDREADVPTDRVLRLEELPRAAAIPT